MRDKIAGETSVSGLIYGRDGENNFIEADGHCLLPPPQLGGCNVFQPSLFVAFCMSRRRRKMYYGHAHLSVCVSVRGPIPTLLHGPGCNSAQVSLLGEW